MRGLRFVHEQPEGYGQGPYPNQPQNQPHSGQPPYQGQQPYPGQQQPPYEQPSYGQPAYGAPQPSWGQPGVGGYGPQDPGPGGWGPPPGPPKKNSGPVIAVAIVAALVLLGGGGAIVWALSGGDSGTKKHTPVAVSTAPTIAPSFPTSVPSFPTTFPTPSGLPTPTSSSTLDQSMFVQAGDCVRISGKAPDLKMIKSDCGSASYKVLKRFSGTSDRTKCRGVAGYTTAFWARSKKYTFMSYVLCLKRL